MEKINELRKHIEELDKKFLEYLYQRLRYSRKLAEVKQQNKILPVRDEKREQELIDMLSQKAKSLGLDQNQVIKIMKEILNYSVNEQKKIISQENKEK